MRKILWVASTGEFVPAAQSFASSVKEMQHMFTYLQAAIAVRLAAIESAGWKKWSDSGFPKIVLRVDEGIDLGSLGDLILKYGNKVGVVLEMVGRGDS